MSDTPSKPKGYEEYLGSYGPQLYDGTSGEITSWGFKIIKHLGEDKFDELRNFGSLECSYPSWYLIVKTLTRAEAIEKYGPITNEEFGPRGGWKSVTFGKKTFSSQKMRPTI
jgi:hypothetical protein